MAKKRERRVGPTADRKSTGAVGAVNSAESPAKRDRKLTTGAVFFFFMVFPAISLMFYARRYSPNTKETIISDRPYASQNGFVTTEMNYLQVLAENMKTSEYSSHRNFTNPVLAYITPWNSLGYETAKKYNNKFTHISPVWYELKSQGTNLVLEGRHNVDKEWILELWRSGNAQVLPRVVLEAIPVNLLKKKKQRDRAVDLIITECMEMEFDGIVLESWSRWAAYGVLHDPDMRSMVWRGIMTRRPYLTLRLWRDITIRSPYPTFHLPHLAGHYGLKALSNTPLTFVTSPQAMKISFSSPQPLHKNSVHSNT